MFTSGVLLAGLVAFAQTATEENKMYLLGPNDALTELSLQGGLIKSNTGITAIIVGVGKSRTFTQFPGTAAPLRLRPSAPQVFVMGMGGAYPLPDRIDTSLVYATLVKLAVNKKAGTRELLSSSFAGAYGIGKSRTADGAIPLNFSRAGDHAIRIEPRARLAPGEYGFQALVRQDAYAPANQVSYYCFGVE